MIGADEQQKPFSAVRNGQGLSDLFFSASQTRTTEKNNNQPEFGRVFPYNPPAQHCVDNQMSSLAEKTVENPPSAHPTTHPMMPLLLSLLSPSLSSCMVSMVGAALLSRFGMTTLALVLLGPKWNLQGLGRVPGHLQLTRQVSVMYQLLNL